MDGAARPAVAPVGWSTTAVMNVAVYARGELVPDVLEAEVVESTLRGDDEVEGPPPRELFGGKAPEDLAKPSLDAVADNGVANLSRHGEPEADDWAASWQELEDQVIAVDAKPLMLNTQEFPALQDAPRLREGLGSATACGACAHRSRSHPG